MSKSCRHLTRDDRSQKYAHKSNGLSNSKIAVKLGFDRRTIDREIKLNSGKRGYRFQQAEAMAVERRWAASSTPRKLVPSLLGGDCGWLMRGMESGADRWPPDIGRT